MADTPVRATGKSVSFSLDRSGSETEKESKNTTVGAEAATALLRPIMKSPSSSNAPGGSGDDKPFACSNAAAVPVQQALKDQPLTSDAGTVSAPTAVFPVEPPNPTTPTPKTTQTEPPKMKVVVSPAFSVPPSTPFVTKIDPNTTLGKALPKTAEAGVWCDECKKYIPHRDWPNHRDRLRTVEIKRGLSKAERYIRTTIIDFVMWIIVNVFFREVAVVGLENIPKEGPVIFYGNHQNQFIDAMMIRAHCSRSVRFIIAEKSMLRPVIGHFARFMDSVPVVRPQDVGSVVGQGKLASMRETTVLGEGTNFKSTLSVGDVISWSVPQAKERRSGQVVSITSDTEMTLSLPVPEGDQAPPGSSFRFSKRIDHSEMYADVYDTLNKKHCIGIFPEGGSHDRTSLQPLKAGVALFTLGAAERGIKNLKIIPCGLTYFYGHKFRSRAHIEFGPPLTTSDELVDEFTRADKRAATKKMLEMLDTALRSVTINVPDWQSLKFLHAFRRLYQPMNCVLQTRDYLCLTRRLSILIQQQNNEETSDPQFQDFRTKVENYCDYCSALFVQDSQAATLEKLDEASFSLFTRRFIFVVILFVVLLPFWLLCGPIGVLIHYAAETHAKTALSGSSVKVVAADVKGSYKIVLGFGIVPLSWFVIALVVAHYSDLRTAATVFCSLPMAMYVSLVILQEFVMECRAIIPLAVSMMSKHKQFKKLHERRTKLVAQAKEIIRRFDPDLEKELKDFVASQKVADAMRQPSLFSLRHASRRLEKMKIT